MRVELTHYTPLELTAMDARTCWMSQDKSDNGGPKDQEFLDRIGNKFKHGSILEHQVYKFHITDISRALLQELARHRMASLSVKSSRYTLKELKEEILFIPHGHITIDNWEVIKQRAAKYLVFTNNDIVDKASVHALDNLRHALECGISNDIAKYCLPESYKTELSWTINARSLQNFISLRSDKAALWEIRKLAQTIYDVIPEDHNFLFKDYLKEN